MKLERGKEGKDQNPHSDAIAAVFDVVRRHTHLDNTPIYTHRRLLKLSPHLTVPERQPEAARI
jgi:hypothetical protein